MANLFAFALAENRLVYQPGETISGSLLLNTDKELNLRSIRVELQGTGHVRIRSGKVTYERREPYLGFQIVVLGRGPQSGNDVRLLPGNYAFPFQFPLPPHSLPTSFEGPYGSVRYWLQAVVDRPWRTNLQITSPLCIVERVQIRDPALMEPCVKNDDRMLGWVCCPSGQLYATARIDRSAYCPGQEVRITGHVSNQSGKQVIGTEVQLVQKALYKAPHDTTRTVTEKIYVLTNEQGFAPGEDGDVHFDAFSVPSVQPTTEGFGCIDISYRIRFKVRVARAFNTEIEFPVIITTVPPSAQPSIEQVLSHQIYSALANYLASRVSAELASDEAADEETETGMGRVALDGSAASNFPGSRQAPAVPLHSSTRNAPANGKPYQYSKIEV